MALSGEFIMALTLLPSRPQTGMSVEIESPELQRPSKSDDASESDYDLVFRMEL